MSASKKTVTRSGGKTELAVGRNSGKVRGLSSTDNEINRGIFRLLQVDGRTSFRTIAKKLNVSEGTVRNRVTWMKQAGMLNIVAVSDPTAINYRADAMLGIKVSPTSSPSKVAERLSGLREVVYMLWVSGRFDLLVEVVANTDEEFHRCLEDHCYNKPDIASLEIMLSLVMYKNQFLLKEDWS